MSQGQGRSVRAGQAYVELTLRDRVSAALSRVQQQFLSIGQSLTAFGARLTAAGAMMAAPLVGVMRAAQQAGDRIRDLAKSQRVSELTAGRMLGFSPDETRAAVMTSEAMEEMRHSLERTYLTIASALAPALERFAAIVTQVSVRVRAWVRANPELIQRLAALSVVVIAGGVAITTMGVAMAGLAVAVKGFVAVGGMLAAVITSWPAMLVGVSAAIAGLVVDWRGFGDQMRDTWRAVVSAVQAGDLQAAFELVVAQVKVIWLEFVSWLKRQTAGGMSWIAQIGDDISTGLAALAVKIGEVVGVISRDQAEMMIADILRQNRLALEQIEEQRRRAMLPSPELQQARQRLEQLRQRAVELPKLQMGAQAPAPARKAKEYPPDIAVQVRGTFSSQAISQTLALGDRFSERMARGIERAARAGEEMVRLMRNMRGLAFS